MVVLVGGGTGNVGSAVVQALSSSGFAVKVLSRDLSTAKASKLSHLPGVSCVQGNMSDRTALASAFDGVTACFLGCSNSEQQVRDEIAFIDAAQSCGCRYLVKLGTCGAPGYTSADSIIQYGRFHAEIEKHLSSTDLEWTVLRPNFFLQNHIADIFGSVPQGVVAYPVQPTSLARSVDVRDVGHLAAKLLMLSPEERRKHQGKIYDVCGPEAVSTTDVAAHFSAALGRTIAAVQISAEDWSGNAEKAGFPGWLAQAVCRNFTDFWDKGLLDFPSSPEVLEILPPSRTLKAWVEEHASLVQAASPSQKLASLLQQPVRLDLPVRRPGRGPLDSGLSEAKPSPWQSPWPWQSEPLAGPGPSPSNPSNRPGPPQRPRDEERRSSAPAFEKRVTMAPHAHHPPAPPAMGRCSSSPSLLREPELRESEPMVPADFPSTLRRVRRGAPSHANIAVGTTRNTSCTAGSTGRTGMHRARGAEQLLELADAREDLMAGAYLRPSTAVQAAAPPAPPARKLQKSKPGHFGALRRTSNMKRPRQAEIDVSPEAVDPYAASFAEVSEVSEGLLLTDHDRGLETKSMDSGFYSWPWQEGIEPLASMLRSLEFQVEALFELMDAHSFKDEADASVVDVINRKREALHNTFAALKEALWWTRRQSERPVSTSMAPRFSGPWAEEAPGLDPESSGLTELEVLQSQLAKRISVVVENGSVEKFKPKEAQAPNLASASATLAQAQEGMTIAWPVVPPIPEGEEDRLKRDFQLQRSPVRPSSWLRELQASWAAGAAAARAEREHTEPAPSWPASRPETRPPEEATSKVQIAEPVTAKDT
ncbi:azoB, partial [Symbiodinium sp. CCMP2456]